MCCGQNRAKLTGHQALRPTTIPSFRRSTPSSAVPRPASKLSAVLPAEPSSVLLAANSSKMTLQNLATPVTLDRTSVPLQYKEQSPIRVRGMATGRVYVFSGSQPVQTVDERDVAALLQTRYFRRA